MAALPLLFLLASTAGCGMAASVSGRFTINMSSQAMEPTLRMGARLLVRRTDGDSPPRLGDVVVFRTPQDWTGVTPDALYVSRVIGLPGSTVSCCNLDGQLQVNGKALDEPYLAAPPASHLRFEVQVPPGRLWLMSDNRHLALDSRAHLTDPGGGTVAISDVAGVAEPANR